MASEPSLPQSAPASPAAASGAAPRSGTRQSEAVLLGIVLVVASTVFLSAGDVLAKYLSASLPPLQIAWMRYLGFVLILLPAVLASGARTVLASRRPGLQALRGLALLGSTLFFFLALPYLAVPELTAIFFVAPVMVTALSAPFLGERVGRARWAAAAVGFAGVMIVIRPGTAAFEPAAILPVIGALSWASGLLVTRRLSGIDPPLTTLAWTALLGFALLSAVAPFVWVPPNWPQLALGALVGIVSLTGHWIVVLAYRHGDASVLAPYSYTQLIWASAFTWLVFGSLPEVWTYVGATIIIASGLFTAHRERVRGRT
jgi:drug/metabolite transporter (DMT)-like permease